GLFDYRGLNWTLAGLKLGLRGDHQRRNGAVALAALEVARAAFPVSEAAVRQGLETVFWPGRLEVVWERPMVILDGAHNNEGIGALVEEMRSLRGERSVKLLFAAMEDKDWPHMLAELSRVASEAVLTRVPMQRSADPGKMSAAVKRRIPVSVVEDPARALQFLLERAGPEDVVLVAGSLYLLGEVRPLLAGRAPAQWAQGHSLGARP
ncbi:MAG: bifunctional folylpolyglutamate synthase/dihydrofolate synthase, partial [Deltaproteobacteria bacterium]|nr:bifunctional folylpolyglutamate synthase/dihydrofolate synthase [Deltaproteobacteria bacterium]